MYYMDSLLTLWTVSQLYRQSAEDDIPTGESADSEVRSTDSSTDSNAYSAKVGVWVRAFRYWGGGGGGGGGQ